MQQVAVPTWMATRSKFCAYLVFAIAAAVIGYAYLADNYFLYLAWLFSLVVLVLAMCTLYDTNGSGLDVVYLVYLVFFLLWARALSVDRLEDGLAWSFVMLLLLAILLMKEVNALTVGFLLSVLLVVAIRLCQG
jgi:hypothetical protein